jgi:hypothetical protein
VGWRRNSLGKRRDEGRPSSPNRVVVVMVLLVDLTHTRPSSLQQLPTCLSFSFSFSLHLGPSKKSFTDESGEQQQHHGQVGSMAAAEKREREREKEEYNCGSTYCAVPAPLSSFTARAFWWGACNRAHLKLGEDFGVGQWGPTLSGPFPYRRGRWGEGGGGVGRVRGSIHGPCRTPKEICTYPFNNALSPQDNLA